jgi:hypothetical protein
MLILSLPTPCHCFYHHLSSSSLSSSHLGKAAATVTHAHAHSCSHEQVNKQQPSTRTQRNNSTTSPASSLARTSLLSTALHADPRWPMTRPHPTARRRVSHLLRLHAPSYLHHNHRKTTLAGCHRPPPSRLSRQLAASARAAAALHLVARAGPTTPPTSPSTPHSAAGVAAVEPSLRLHSAAVSPSCRTP